MGRKRMVYTPDAYVSVEVFTEVAAVSAITFAPVITAPLGSVTWPVMEPVTVCPNADDKNKRTASEHPARYFTSFVLMRPSLQSFWSSSPRGEGALKKPDRKNLSAEVLPLSSTK